jgi:sporulation protein YlmC with PRC-barrel domain
LCGGCRGREEVTGGMDGDILLSDLLGRRVVDEDGRELGRVHEVRADSVAQPRVGELLVGGRSLRARLLGERPRDDEVPRGMRVVSLEDVRDAGHEPIVTRTKERG